MDDIPFGIGVRIVLASTIILQAFLRVPLPLLQGSDQPTLPESEKPIDDRKKHHHQPDMNEHHHRGQSMFPSRLAALTFDVSR